MTEVRIVDGAKGPQLRLVDGGGSAWAVLWPGMGARHRSFHRITLAPHARTVEQCHPMEAVYYVNAGTAVVTDAGDGSRHKVGEGAMVHVEPGTSYTFEAGPQGGELLGGPCPPDPLLYAGPVT